MKLVVVSHPCVTPVNQKFYARVEQRTGWQVTLVVPRRWRTGFGTEVVARSWPAFRGRLVPRRVLLSGNIPLHVYATRLARLLAREAPAALFVDHEPFAAATFQTFLANARSVDAAIGFRSSQNIRKRYPAPFAASERYVYRRADFAFPLSGMVEDVLREKGYAGPAAILPASRHTVSRGEAQPPPESRAERFTVGYVGRLVPEKGIDTLLEALALVEPPKDVRCSIVGEGSGAGDLKRYARRLGVADRVSWKGYVDPEEVLDVYRLLDVVVVPSRTMPNWKEQFGRVVIESLEHGVPVITSTSGELPHLVDLTGGGWTFPEGDSRALAAILERLSDRPAELTARGRRGREVIRREFDVDRLTDRFTEVVRTAVAARAARQGPAQR